MANIERSGRKIHFISREVGWLCSWLRTYFWSKWESTPLKYVGTLLEYKTPDGCCWIDI